MRSGTAADVPDDRWTWDRAPVGSPRPGTSRAGWVGVVVAVLWVVVAGVGLEVSDTVAAAARASADWAARDPLADPPATVARAEFVVGLLGVSALPTAVAVTLAGSRGVLRGWRSGRAVGWVALVVGGVGLLPALGACVIGLVVCGTTLGALSPT